MKSGNAIQRLRAARAALLFDHPFFGALALRMTLAADARPDVTTMATDGRTLFYSTDFVDGCTDEELQGLWCHEVLHPAMHHNTRRGTRDQDMWNIAADYAINPIVLETKLVLPKDALVSSEYKGMSAEQIYQRLEERPKSDKPGAGGAGAGPGGQGKGKAEVPGGILDAPDQAQDEAEWQVAVQQAANAARMAGKMPGSMQKVVEEMTRPRTDWRSLLRRFVQQCAQADYSWKMPDRRFVAQGLYLPQIRSEEMGPIVVYVDSSGSTYSVVPMFKAELQSIVDEMKPERTIVIMVDAKVQRVDTFERDDQIQFNLTGLGGTSFTPGFEHVEEEGIQPACAIYLTDGEGRFPDKAPDYPVIWAISTDIVAPWGETVRLEA